MISRKPWSEMSFLLSVASASVSTPLRRIGAATSERVGATLTVTAVGIASFNRIQLTGADNNTPSAAGSTPHSFAMTGAVNDIDRTSNPSIILRTVKSVMTTIWNPVIGPLLRTAFG